MTYHQTTDHYSQHMTQEPNNVVYSQQAAFHPSSEQHTLLGHPSSQPYQQPMQQHYEYNLPSVPESTRNEEGYWCRTKQFVHMNGDGVYKATLVTLIVYIVVNCLALWTSLPFLALLNIGVAIYGGIAIKRRQTSRVAIFSGILVFKMVSDLVAWLYMVYVVLTGNYRSPKFSGQLRSVALFGLTYLVQIPLFILTLIHLNREYKREQLQESTQTEVPVYSSEPATFIQVNQTADQMTVQQQPTTIYPVAQQQQPSVYMFEAQANVMREMGFTNESLVKSTLEKYNGDVASAVREIVASSQL